MSSIASMSRLRTGLVAAQKPSVLATIRRNRVIICAIKSSEEKGFASKTPAQTERETISKSVSEKPPAVTPESAKELLEELSDPAAFGTRGEFWFFGQLILTAMVVFPPGGIRQVVDVLGYASLLFGLALISVGGFDLGQNLTPVPKPRDSSSLVTDGVYELVRHPMYGGLIISAAGLSLASGDGARLALTVALGVLLDRKASYEEELLEQRYGNAYKSYKGGKAKKLIPWLW